MPESRFAEMPIPEGASLIAFRAFVVGAVLVVAFVAVVTVQDRLRLFPFWEGRWGTNAAFWLTAGTGLFGAFWSWIVWLIALAWNPNVFKRRVERSQRKDIWTTIAIGAGAYLSLCFVELSSRRPDQLMLVMPFAVLGFSSVIRPVARRLNWSPLRIVAILLVILVAAIVLYRRG